MVNISRRPRGVLNAKMALSYMSTNMREEFIQRCGEEFDRVIAAKDAMIREMELHYEYKYGQVVKMTDNNSIMDSDLGITKLSYGIIVGHSDFEKLSDASRYYRVYLSQDIQFLGRDGSCLEPVLDETEIPEEFLLSQVEVQARIGGEVLRAICVFSTTN